MTTPLTRAELDAALALANAATPGPWRGDRLDGTVKYEVLGADDVQVLCVDHKNGEYGFFSDNNAADEAFFLASRSLVPAARRDRASLAAEVGARVVA